MEVQDETRGVDLLVGSSSRIVLMLVVDIELGMPSDRELATGSVARGEESYRDEVCGMGSPTGQISRTGKSRDYFSSQHGSRLDSCATGIPLRVCRSRTPRRCQ